MDRILLALFLEILSKEDHPLPQIKSDTRSVHVRLGDRLQISHDLLGFCDTKKTFWLVPTKTMDLDPLKIS